MSNDAGSISISRQTILEQCRRCGLQVDDVERRGEVLLLHPAVDGQLPGSEQLNQLAETLDVQGIRYITLALDRWCDGDETTGGSDE